MSSFGIAVRALDFAGGAQMTQANPWARIGGQPIVVIGDLVAAHGTAPHSPPPPMVEGESWARINGVPICRVGHHAACGHATTGRPWARLTPKS